MHFRARIETEDEGIFVILPFDAKVEFGRARAPVQVTIRGVSYRTTIAVYGGKSYLILPKPVREKADLSVGETIAIDMALDDKERIVEVPAALAAALRKDAAARAAWEKLSYTRRKEIAAGIEGAKKEETRAKRVAAAIAELRSP